MICGTGKIPYLFNEQEVLETLFIGLEKPPRWEHRTTRCDLEPNKNQKDRCTHFMMLSSMQNDLINHFDVPNLAKEVCNALRSAFCWHLCY